MLVGWGGGGVLWNGSRIEDGAFNCRMLRFFVVFGRDFKGLYGK